MLDKTIFFIFLFLYFGFMAVPQWFHAYSAQFIIWLMALPFVLLILLMTGAWGLAGIVGARVVKKAPNYRRVVFAKLSCAGFLWLGCSLLLASCTHYLYNHQKFDSAIWQAQKPVNYVSDALTPRQKMVDDLINHLLPGSTRAEIISMLGESTKNGYLPKTKKELLYLLGPERGLGVDSEWLLIWFDDTDYFNRCELLTD